MNRVPDALRRGEHHHTPSWYTSRLQGQIFHLYERPEIALTLCIDLDLTSIIFGLLWVAVLCLVLYSILKSCLQSRPTANARRPGSGPSGPSRGFRWSSTHRPDDHTNDAPPPYTKYSNSSYTTRAADPAWRPGFWTGAALGGLGAYLAGNNARQRENPTATQYDWERERQGRMPRVSPVANPSYTTSQRRSFFSSEDRGEGSSNLGSMRRSTGLGGSNVR